jgi:hypothetical protein
MFALTGEIDAAYQYGKLALRLVDEGNHSSQDGRAITMTLLFVWHWKNPYRIALHAAGDIEYRFFSIIGYSMTSYHYGLQQDNGLVGRLRPNALSFHLPNSSAIYSESHGQK